MKKEANVHRLPTEKGTIATYKKTGNLAKPNFRIGIFESDIYQPQHLYITTDEEIKEGDWYIHPDATVPQNDFNHVYVDCRKIIATTDPNLTTRCKGCKRVIKGSPNNPPFTNCTCISKTPQSFIEEYCKAGGIDKVYVELGAIPADRAPNGWDTFIKKDSNNCIIIHPVEEKMIPLSQVTDLMVKFSNDLANWKLPKGPVANWLNEWIKENL